MDSAKSILVGSARTTSVETIKNILLGIAKSTLVGSAQFIGGFS